MFYRRLLSVSVLFVLVIIGHVSLVAAEPIAEPLDEKISGIVSLKDLHDAHGFLLFTRASEDDQSAVYSLIVTEMISDVSKSFLGRYTFNLKTWSEVEDSIQPFTLIRVDESTIEDIVLIETDGETLYYRQGSDVDTTTVKSIPMAHVKTIVPPRGAELKPDQVNTLIQERFTPEEREKKSRSTLEAGGGFGRASFAFQSRLEWYPDPEYRANSEEVLTYLFTAWSFRPWEDHKPGYFAELNFLSSDGSVTTLEDNDFLWLTDYTYRQFSGGAGVFWDVPVKESFLISVRGGPYVGFAELEFEGYSTFIGPRSKPGYKHFLSFMAKTQITWDVSEDVALSAGILCMYLPAIDIEPALEIERFNDLRGPHDIEIPTKINDTWIVPLFVSVVF